VEALQIEKEGLIDNDHDWSIAFMMKIKILLLSRSLLGESKLRYITVKTDKDNNKLFGVDRINKEETIYVVEGHY
jgi:hypothetical protein